jgi:hypothetical protein
MTGKIKIVAPLTASDYEILKVLQEHCFMITDIKVLTGRSISLEIEVFTILGNENI